MFYGVFPTNTTCCDVKKKFQTFQGYFEVNFRKLDSGTCLEFNLFFLKTPIWEISG